MARDLAHLSDEAVVAMAARSDDLAFAELYDRYGRVAYRLALRVLRDEALAEDAVQDAFLAIWRGASRFIPERGRASAWILTLVHRRAVDLVRREDRRRTEPLSGDEPAAGEEQRRGRGLAPARARARPDGAPAALRSAARGAGARLLWGLHAVRAGGETRPAARHDQEPHVCRPDPVERAARSPRERRSVDDNALHELTAGYALDALDPAEDAVYEGHLAHCEQCQAELAGLSAAAGALAYGAGPVEPPAALRERILAAARAERSNVVPIHKASGFRDRNTAFRVLAVAASVAAIGLGVWNIVLHQQLNESEAQRSVLLHGAAGSVVLGANGQGTMTVANLATAPAGKTYEAWVIQDGKASPAGTFEAEGKTVVVHLTARCRPGRSSRSRSSARAGRSSQQYVLEPLKQMRNGNVLLAAPTRRRARS